MNHAIPEGHEQERKADVRYVVALSCAMDNLIVKAFDSIAETNAFMYKNPPYPTRDDGHNCDAVRHAYAVYGNDVGSVYGYEVITLVDGVPHHRDLLWWGDENCPWRPADGWFVDFSQTIRPNGDGDE